jgi:hypothetical protein
MGATLSALEARGLVERRPDPFHHGLQVVFAVAAALAAVAALASLLRGGRYVHPEAPGESRPEAPTRKEEQTR